MAFPIFRLTGPPGTGKTLLAKAVAGEADVPFFYCSGSEFEEMFIGLGAKRVRELFAQAKKSTPCIIFIDEIDAIGGTRKEKDNQAMRMTLNQLLVELDGFESSEGIIIIGATNFPEMLDAALIRPGRFDREVGVPLPDVNDRKEIIEHYLSLVKASKEVDATVLARGTPGCSGADLSNIINIAAIESAVRNLPQVTQEILEFAKDKVLMGAERKSQVLSDKVKKITAFHEGGHAIMALFSEGSMPIHKATIIPRGQSLGMVMRLPEGDQFSKSKKELLADLDVAMGGRVAEELILGHDNVTTGASSDLHQASRIARAMVMAYGMSESLGPIDCSRNLKELSGETRQKIDEEVKKLLEASYTRAKNLLTSKHKELETLARSLLMYETLTGDEVRAIVDGKQIDKMIVNEIPWPMSE